MILPINATSLFGVSIPPLLGESYYINPSSKSTKKCALHILKPDPWQSPELRVIFQTVSPEFVPCLPQPRQAADTVAWCCLDMAALGLGLAALLNQRVGRRPGSCTESWNMLESREALNHCQRWLDLRERWNIPIYRCFKDFQRVFLICSHCAEMIFKRCCRPFFWWAGRCSIHLGVVWEG